jgi:hypothetical protein
MSLVDVVRLVRPLRTIALFLHRFRTAFGYYRGPLRELLFWLFQSRETTNFTYELTPISRRYLASLIADVLGKPYEEILRYMAELEDDLDLRSHIRAATEARREERADSEARYGRRMGWYAITRATRPRVVVETGVDKGLGSCVLTVALARNTAEGFPGYYYGTDINPKAGYLLDGRYKQFGEILYGDSLTSLRRFDRSIDLFINDSDHSAEYEKAEYEAVAQRLSARAIVLGDNSHCTDQLLVFALATGRQFVFFHETPDRHWYPGGGMGIAFRRS